MILPDGEWETFLEDLKEFQEPTGKSDWSKRIDNNPKCCLCGENADRLVIDKWICEDCIVLLPNGENAKVLEFTEKERNNILK